MEEYIISKKDIHKNYFHMTNEKNIENIKKYGLLPNIGPHAKYIEKSEKFFLLKVLIIS